MLGLMGYSLPIPVFFELSESKGQTRACRVRFEVLGAPLRPVLCNPKHTPLVPSAVEQLFKAGRKHNFDKLWFQRRGLMDWFQPPWKRVLPQSITAAVAAAQVDVPKV